MLTHASADGAPRMTRAQAAHALGADPARLEDALPGRAHGAPDERANDAPDERANDAPGCACTRPLRRWRR